MSKTVNVAAAWLLLCAVIYALAAFVSWEINPGEWERSTRLFVAGVMMIALWLVALIGYEVGS